MSLTNAVENTREEHRKEVSKKFKKVFGQDPQQVEVVDDELAVIQHDSIVLSCKKVATGSYIFMLSRDLTKSQIKNFKDLYHKIMKEK